MTREQFIKAWAKAKLAGKPVCSALQGHLVDGEPAEAVIRRMRISRDTFARALAKLHAAFNSMDWDRPDGRKKA